MNPTANPAPLGALADIELPTPPDWRPLIVIGAVLLLLLIGAITLLVRHRRTDSRTPAPARLMPARSLPADASPVPQRPAERLAHLHQAWSEGRISDRAAGYRLAALLRQGHGLSRLDAGTPPPPGIGDNDGWAATVTLLHRLRYEAAPDAALTTAVFERVRTWLADATNRGSGNRV